MAYTNIDDPSAFFQIKLWTGTGSSQTVNFDGNSNLQADWIWHKEQNDTNGWHQTDTSIGIANYLATQDTAAAYAVGSAYVSGIGSNSISYGGGDSSFNSNSVAQATWAWKANGGTTSSNTDGSLTSTVQANTTAGFSIVTYSNPSTNDNTIGHGLGVQPEIIIFKNTVDAINWYVASKYLSNYTTKYLELDTTDAEQTHADGMNSTAPTSSVFSVGGISRTGDSGNLAVAYCFASKQGYSKFGKYRGNSSTDGTFVYLGFKPRWLMIKSTQAGMSWDIIDTARSTSNVMDDYLTANTTDPQGTSATKNVDFLSNGFKWRYNNNTNFSDHTYIYMAFAENPFVTSTGIPTTAR